MSVAIKKFWKSRGTLIGGPTLNNIMYPTVAEFLTHLRGLRPKNRLVGAFGSYGWGGGAVKEAYEECRRMGLEIFEPGLQVLYSHRGKTRLPVTISGGNSPKGFANIIPRFRFPSELPDGNRSVPLSHLPYKRG